MTRRCSRLVTFHNVPIKYDIQIFTLNAHIKNSATATAIITDIPNTYLAKTPYLRQFLAYWLEEEKLIDNYNVQHTIHSMSTKEMKRNPEAKGGASPATNASFDPERGYGTSEQKEKIKEQANK